MVHVLLRERRDRKVRERRGREVKVKSTRERRWGEGFDPLNNSAWRPLCPPSPWSILDPPLGRYDVSHSEDFMMPIADHADTVCSRPKSFFHLFLLLSRSSSR